MLIAQKNNGDTDSVSLLDLLTSKYAVVSLYTKQQMDAKSHTRSDPGWIIYKSS